MLAFRIGIKLGRFDRGDLVAAALRTQPEGAERGSFMSAYDDQRGRVALAFVMEAIQEHARGGDVVGQEWIVTGLEILLPNRVLHAAGGQTAHAVFVGGIVPELAFHRCAIAVSAKIETEHRVSFLLETLSQHVPTFLFAMAADIVQEQNAGSILAFGALVPGAPELHAIEAGEADVLADNRRRRGSGLDREL